MFFMMPAHGFIVCTPLSDGTAPATVMPAHAAPAWVELMMYLGDQFNPAHMLGNDQAMEEEFARYPDAQTFYAENTRYLYHLTAYFLEGWKRPGYSWLLKAIGTGPVRSVLDYGCGIGCDGLWFLDQGIRVNFAELDNPCRQYLAWRLTHRYGHRAVIYDVHEAIPHHDVVWCMDVIEHLPPAQQQPFMEHLATLGDIVLVNLVDDRTAQGTLHHPIDVEGLTTAMGEQWDCAVQDWYEQPNGSKVRFLAYGPQVAKDETSSPKVSAALVEVGGANGL